MKKKLIVILENPLIPGEEVIKLSSVEDGNIMLDLMEVTKNLVSLKELRQALNELEHFHDIDRIKVLQNTVLVKNDLLEAKTEDGFTYYY